MRRLAWSRIGGAIALLGLSLTCPVHVAHAQPDAASPVPESQATSAVDGLSPSGAPSRESDAVFQPTQLESKLVLNENDSRRIQLPTRISQVDGFDPAIVKVMGVPGSPNQVRLVAIASGITQLVLIDEFQKSYTINLQVLGDVRQLEAILREAFPEATVQAVKVKGAVLLTGWVNEQEQLTPIVEIAEQFFPKVLNYIKVGGVQQVMLRVKIMEVQRAKIRKMGINFLHLDEHGYAQSAPGALAPLNLRTDPMTLPFGGPPAANLDPTAFSASQFNFGLATSQYVFSGFIEALKEERLLKILAEPNLVAVNGRQANFLNGGEFPVPVPQALGTLTIQWREFGVRLQFVPYVLGNGRLRLDVEPEVSDTDPTNGVTLNGTTVNGLSTRRVQTQVEMNFGQTLVIAGLLNNRTRSVTQKTPFLGELPWIGAAFRRVREEESETELLVMVTPELVAALDPEQVPAEYPGSSTTSPTDKELMGLGLIEVPNVAGSVCPDCRPNGAGALHLLPPGTSYDGPGDPLTPQPELGPGPAPAPPTAADVPPPPQASTRGSRGVYSTRPGYLTDQKQKSKPHPYGKATTALPATGARANGIQQVGGTDNAPLGSGVQTSGYTTQSTVPATTRRTANRPGLITP